VLEAGVRKFFADIDAERFDRLAEQLAADAEHADELTGAWLRGRQEIGRYLRAHQGLVTELESRILGLQARWLAVGVGNVTFLLHQTYRLAGSPRTESMSGSALFMVDGERLLLRMLHLGTAAATSAELLDSRPPSDLDSLALEAQGTPDPPGGTIRRLRKNAQMSVRALAKEAGLSPGFLSQIERGLADPSVQSMRKLASVLNVPVAALLDTSLATPSFVLRGAGRRKTTFPDSGVGYETLQPQPDSYLDLWIGTLPSGVTSSAALQSHDGDEVIVVLSGQLRLESVGELVDLRVGDSAYFPAGVPHRLIACGGREVRFLSALTRPSRSQEITSAPRTEAQRRADSKHYHVAH
jgi:transcriptional regulator with XRE-family HTH domain